MIEITQAQIARSVDVLKSGPMPAKVFAEKMWPGRHKDPGTASRAGHAILHRLGTFGYVEKTGEMWFLRSFSGSTVSAPWVGSRVVPTVQPMSGPLVGPPAVPLVQSPTGPLVIPSAESSDELLARQRLAELVGLADNPVVGVEHDAVYGSLSIRGMRVDACILEACTFAVLQGRSINVYPPAGSMLVALLPIEGARALHVRWKQSGVPPQLPHRGGSAWITLDDGVVAARGCWRPLGASPQWQTLEEPLGNRIARQRAEAGLGPPVNVGR
jgi:hypothetical protein